MNGTMTVADVMIGIGLITAILTLWWRVENRVSSGAKDAMAQAQKAMAHAQKVETDLHDYKLEVAENYAKNGFIRDVEDRLGKRFDAIVIELHGMREDFQKAMLEMASSKPTRRRT